MHEVQESMGIGGGGVTAMERSAVGVKQRPVPLEVEWRKKSHASLPPRGILKIPYRRYYLCNTSQL